MAEKRLVLTKWELVDAVKICAEAIEDEADNIIGNYDKFDSVTVSFTIKKYPDEQMAVKIDRTFIQEKRQKNTRKRKNTKN